MKNLIILLTLLIVTNLFSQEKLLTKQEVINNVVNNNIALKIADENYHVSQADYKQSRAVYLPNIKVSYTGVTSTSPLMAFGSLLNQEIVRQADFNPDLLNNPDRFENFNAKLEVQQPLINMDGIYKRKAAKIKLEAVALQKERTTDYLTFEVEKAYMQLQLAYKAVDVLEIALTTAQTNRQHAQNSFDQGYMQKADMLQVEVRVNEVKNQLVTAKSNVNNASDYLNTLMNSKNYTLIKPADSLQVNTLFKAANTISLERSDFKAMKIATKAREQMYKSNKMAFLPRLNAFGSFEFNDDKVFQADANNYLVGAQLSWYVFEGAQRYSKVQRSKAEVDKSKLELEQYIANNNTEFNKAKRMHIDAKNKLSLSELAMSQSKESLRIRNNRFKQGLEKVSDVLISETMYAKKQLEYYQTIFELNYAEAYLKFLSK
jgi:outer membrane protein TolC